MDNISNRYFKDKTKFSFRQSGVLFYKFVNNSKVSVRILNKHYWKEEWKSRHWTTNPAKSYIKLKKKTNKKNLKTAFDVNNFRHAGAFLLNREILRAELYWTSKHRNIGIYYYIYLFIFLKYSKYIFCLNSVNCAELQRTIKRVSVIMITQYLFSCAVTFHKLYLACLDIRNCPRIPNCFNPKHLVTKRV